MKPVSLNALKAFRKLQQVNYFYFAKLLCFCL